MFAAFIAEKPTNNIDCTDLQRYGPPSEQSFGNDIKLSSWYLQVLGVSPAYRRRGAGRALMKYGEDKVQSTLPLRVD